MVVTMRNMVLNRTGLLILMLIGLEEEREVHQCGCRGGTWLVVVVVVVQMKYISSRVRSERLIDRKRLLCLVEWTSFSRDRYYPGLNFNHRPHRSCCGSAKRSYSQLRGYPRRRVKEFGFRELPASSPYVISPFLSIEPAHRSDLTLE